MHVTLPAIGNWPASRWERAQLPYPG